MTSIPRTQETINPQAVPARVYLERMVSVYRSSVDTKGEDRTLRSVLEEVRDGKLAKLIAEARQLHQAIPPLPEGLLTDDTKGIKAWQAADPEAHAHWHEATEKYRAAKRRLPAFIPSGTFRPYHRHGETPPPGHLERFPDCSSTGLREHTGVVVADLDHLKAHGADPEQLLEQFADHPAVVGGYSSPSDDGLKVSVAVHPVPWYDASHAKAWAAVKAALAGIYAYIDPSGKNLSRMCFLSDHLTGYIALDDKVITPVLWEPGEEPDPKPDPTPTSNRRGAPRTGPRFENCETRLDRARAIAALEFLAAAGVGVDDNKLLGVGICMKSMGHPFQDWDEWAGSAGCTCSDRIVRWDSFPTNDLDYSAILGMAYRMGWKRGPNSQGDDAQGGQGDAQDVPPGIPLRPDFDAMRAAGWMMDNRKRLTRGANVNAVLALEALGLRYRYDEWAGLVRDEAGDPVDLKELPDQLKCTIERRFVRVNYSPTLSSVEAAVRIIARGDTFNPVVDLLRSTPWDGQDRTGHFGALAFGTPDEALYNEQAALIPRGAVVRALEPGARFPYIPILYSRQQGTAKGDALQLIAPAGLVSGAAFGGFDWERKLGELIGEFSIAEVAEMSGLPWSELRNMKDTATRTFLRYRASYARAAESHPMKTIIVATSNERAVLTDSGHRRTPVIEIPEGREIDLGWLRANVQQIWAQVCWEYDQSRFQETSGTAVRLPRELWEAANANSEHHVVEDGLEVWLTTRLTGDEGMVESVASAQLRDEMRKAKLPEPKPADFGKAMNKLGYVNDIRRSNGKVTRGWFREAPETP